MTEPRLTTTVPTGRPYTGSCHCGAIRYIIYLTLPHIPPEPTTQTLRGMQVFYRCNCTTCHKAGILHMRVPSPPDDFLLLSPLDPLRELGDYTCFERRLHFLFCRRCGVRCFTFAGEGEVFERVVPETQNAMVACGERMEGEKVAAWSPKRGWVEDRERYLSVNAYTLDAGQEGVDLREWTERKWVMYLDCLTGRDGPMEKRYERPFAGGAY